MSFDLSIRPNEAKDWCRNMKSMEVSQRGRACHPVLSIGMIERLDLTTRLLIFNESSSKLETRVLMSWLHQNKSKQYLP